MNIITESNNTTFIYIDGSYFCYHRYFSVIKWWNMAHPDKKDIIPIETPEFVEKFKKTFLEKVKEIPEMLKINKHQKIVMIVAKDCRRPNIWRNELFSEYKKNRMPEGFLGGPIFQMVYEENMFQAAGVAHLLYHPRLEADDCIAIFVKQITDKFPTSMNYIITSDRDYIQLITDRVQIYDLAYKNIMMNKLSLGNAKDDLHIKIIMGDKSDNIPAIFAKCGVKTAKKYITDPVRLCEKLQNTDILKQYELNTKLIKFDHIPLLLKNEFIESTHHLLANFV